MIVYKVCAIQKTCNGITKYLSTNSCFMGICKYILEYKINQETTSLNGIFCFKNLENAELFLRQNLCGAGVIFKCKAKKVRKIKYISRYLDEKEIDNFLSLKRQRVSLLKYTHNIVAYAIPGTYLADSVTPLEIV